MVERINKSKRILEAAGAQSRKAIERSQKIEMLDLSGDQMPASFNENASFNEVVFSEEWKKFRGQDYWDYREAWRKVPEEKMETPFPIHVDIETTNVCNLVCPMCPRTIHIANEKFSDLGYMSIREYEAIIDQVIEGGGRSIKLNYLGEPLAHKDVVSQVKYAKDRGVIDVMLNTNASLLTKKMGEALLTAGLDALFVSFDAIDPQDFEIQRRGTSLGKVIDNVFNFSRLRKEINPGCHLRLSMVMYKEPKWMAQFEAMKVMWANHIDSLGYGLYVDRGISKYFPEVEGFHCSQPFQRIFLKYNGNVTACCVDDKDEIVFGNWRETELRGIWTSDVYKEFRKKHSSGRYYDIEMCKKCYLPHS